MIYVHICTLGDEKMKKKKFMSLMLAVVILMCSFVPSFAAKKGDVDFNGTVEAADARLALRCAVSLETLSEEQLKIADMDADGVITSADARLILRTAVGLESVVEQEEVKEAEMIDTGDGEIEFSVFEKALYDTAHPLLGLTKSNEILVTFPKWCCIYTMVDVFRPTLKSIGFTDERINEVAPLIIVPSFLNNYYQTHSEYAEYYVFYEYYDEIITQSVYSPTPNTVTYEPKVGDIMFMSNKTRTYQTVNGVEYPTVDHTAQIIEVYDDGTFLCTEGSIIESPDPYARVRERVYRYNEEIGTYEFVNNSVVIVLGVARPLL